MSEYITNYVKVLEEKINKKAKFTKEEINNLKDKITYFQHERLIHLLVTIAYIFFTLIFLAFGLISTLFLIPFFICIIFDIFYIRHYFLLNLL